MVAKANQLANLSGVQLGKPYYINETGGSSPFRVSYAEFAVFDQGGVATPIQPGEVGITIRIQAVYAIQ